MCEGRGNGVRKGRKGVRKGGKGVEGKGVRGGEWCKERGEGCEGRGDNGKDETNVHIKENNQNRQVKYPPYFPSPC